MVTLGYPSLQNVAGNCMLSHTGRAMTLRSATDSFRDPHPHGLARPAVAPREVGNQPHLGAADDAWVPGPRGIGEGVQVVGLHQVEASFQEDDRLVAELRSDRLERG